MISGRRLLRLRHLTATEMAWRARGAGLRAIERVECRLHTPAWRRESLADVLVGDKLLRNVRTLVTKAQYLDAHHALASHVRGRPARFLLHPCMRSAARTRVLSTYPSAAAEARDRADQILRNEYDLLGYTRLPLAGRDAAIDWHTDPVSRRRPPHRFWADVPYLDPASGDHKVIWELNRHQHWLALGRAWWLAGDRRYRERVIGELASWMTANPPRMGINWASALEVAIRTLSWTWAIEFFADDDQADESPWLVDLLLGLEAQIAHVERTLSWYFSPNTHLLGEALALYVCGLAWPELRHARRRAQLGGDILVGQIARQILSDGVHAERSPYYHRYALDFYLLALSMARLAGDSRREPALEEICTRMSAALWQLTDAGGRAPLIGDDDGGELFPIAGYTRDDVRPALGWAAVVLDRPDLGLGPPPEPVLWLTAGPTAETDVARTIRTASTSPPVLADSGYYVSRRDGSLLVFDAGAHGFLNGGHAHADALAVTLSVGSHRLLADCGTGTYTMDPELRDRLRSSQSHNTVTIDDRSQSVPGGPFHWARTASASPRRIVNGAGFDFFHAATDAYLPVTHERFVLATGERRWIVADLVTGTGTHSAAAHWHIAPDWRVLPDDRGAWTLNHALGTFARLAVPGARVEMFNGDPVTRLGWVAPVYGQLVPATTLRAVAKGEPPLWIVTVIEQSEPSDSEIVSVPLDMRASGSHGPTCGVLTRRARGAHLTIFRASAARDIVTLPADDTGRTVITTDAALVHAEFTGSGLLQRVCLVDATMFRMTDPVPIAIGCTKPVADLDLRFDQGTATVATRDGSPAAVSVALGHAAAEDERHGDARLDRPSARMTCVASPVSPMR
jgi:uncharacterized heparinase superfamily protein